MRVTRRLTMLLAAAGVAVLMVGGVAYAATFIGTDRDETLVGTEYRDTIRAEGGDDKVRGLGGDDRLRGGFGNDIIRGGKGDDIIYAQDINQTTDRGTRDEVYCGPGYDIVYLDERDRFPRDRDGCEEGTIVSP